jgi:hypothetical protein
MEVCQCPKALSETPHHDRVLGFLVPGSWRAVWTSDSISNCTTPLPGQAVRPLQMATFSHGWVVQKFQPSRPPFFSQLYFHSVPLGLAVVLLLLLTHTAAWELTELLEISTLSTAASRHTYADVPPLGTDTTPMRV